MGITKGSGVCGFVCKFSKWNVSSFGIGTTSPPLEWVRMERSRDQSPSPGSQGPIITVPGGGSGSESSKLMVDSPS